MQKAFAMIEIVLAILVIMIASFGVYSLYNQAKVASTELSIENQVLAIAGVYAQSYASDLTSSITDGAKLAAFLKATNKLSPNYFDSDGNIVNSQGQLNFKFPSDTDKSQLKITIPVMIGSEITICSALISSTLIKSNSCTQEDDGSISVTVSVGGS